MTGSKYPDALSKFHRSATINPTEKDSFTKQTNKVNNISCNYAKRSIMLKVTSTYL